MQWELGNGHFERPMTRIRMKIRIPTRAIRRRSFLLFLLIFLAIILATLTIHYQYAEEEAFNYFLEIEARRDVGLLVDTPFCKILNVSATDPSIIEMVLTLPEIECDIQKRSWTYVDKTDLVMNKSAIISSGFSFSSISCCYSAITRVSEPLENYTVNADNTVMMSPDCTTIHGTRTRMRNDNIRVVCTSKYWPYQSAIVYRAFHIFAIAERSAETRKKMEFWSKKNPPDVDVPPNVLLLGIDSLSRLSFTRNMPKTREILERIGGIEFFGYTKVGENTFPNQVAFISGYSEDEMVTFCYFNRWKLQDYCPYIWKRFSQANYFTALVEDTPEVTGFNYLKTGFVKQPVDYYYRPYILGVYKYAPVLFYETPCVGTEQSERNFLNYIKDLMVMSNTSRVPLFLHSWETNLAHTDINGAQQGDAEFSEFFSQNLTNTILIFLSDHGYRFGKIRNTFVGWLEDKLPTLWFVLSPDLRLKYPQWERNLKINSKRLTSAFDLYQTMSYLLDITTPTVAEEATSPDGKALPRTKGVSLLSKLVPEDRKCDDAGVPDGYCACVIPVQLPLDDERVSSAASAAIDFINDFLPSNLCAELNLKSINSGAVLDKGEDLFSYIVSFWAGPGSFLFEANVEYNAEKGTYRVTTQILRMNRVNTDITCVADNSLYELYCLCL